MMDATCLMAEESGGGLAVFPEVMSLSQKSCALGDEGKQREQLS